MTDNYRYEYIGENGYNSACNIYVLMFNGTKYIGFEDIDEGDSVTNCAELLATSIIRQNGWDPKDCLFFEWYNFNNVEDQDLIDISTVDEIIYRWNEDKTASYAKWQPYCDLIDNPFKK